MVATLRPGDARGQRFQRKEPPPVGRWYVVDREDGIVVRAFEREGHDLPLLRATGIVQAEPYAVAAVLGDAAELHRWMAFTAESRLLERRDRLHYRFYQRMGAPWPVSDRDVVLSVDVGVDTERGQLTARFRNVRDGRAPPVDGVVRMPRLSGRYELRALPHKRTRANLLIDANPGGSLPTWLVRATTRQLPLEMLQTLRQRVAQVGQRYARDVADFRARHGELQITAR